VGEASVLLGEEEWPTTKIVEDPLSAVRICAERYQAVVVLKGAHSLVAAPDGRVRINVTGNEAMASGGMGDVLTGLVGALLAQGLDAYDAATVGVFLHGLAGDMVAQTIGKRGILASEVAHQLPRCMTETDLALVGKLRVFPSYI